MTTRRVVVAGIAVLCSCAAAALEQVEGIAVRIAGGAPVYIERHRIEERTHRVDYRTPDGAAIGALRLDYRCSDTAPDFVQVDDRAQLREAGRWQQGRYRVERGTPDAPPARAAMLEPDNAPLVASSGFDRFLRAHWERLQGGESIVFRFAMAARLAGIRLRARRDPLPADGLTWFVIEPAQAWLRVLADPIRVAYDAERRLARYRGLSNLADADGSALVVEIRYTHHLSPPPDLAVTEPRAPGTRINNDSQCPSERT